MPLTIFINWHIVTICQSRVATGRYQTTSEVVREALRLLERQENERAEILRALKSRLRRSAAQAERGELVDGDHVFDEMRSLIGQRQKPQNKRS